MKFILLALLSTAAFANNEAAYTDQILSTETFKVYLYADHGAITCSDTFESDFGRFSGSVSLRNPGGKWGQDRVSDRAADRASRVEFFSMALPEGVTCAQLGPQIPRDNLYVNVTRTVSGKLVKGERDSQMIITENLKINLTRDIILTGEYEWMDFVIPNYKVNPNRKPELLLFDHESHEKELKTRIARVADRLSCQLDARNQKRFQLNMQIGLGEKGNTKLVSRLFPSEEACIDKLTEMVAELEIGDIDGAGHTLRGSRKLSHIRRKVVLGNNQYRTDLTRLETVNLNLLGVKFVGVSAIPLRQVSDPNHL